MSLNVYCKINFNVFYYENVKLLYSFITSCSNDSNELVTQEDLTLDISTRIAILSELETTITAEKRIPIKYESSEVIETGGQIYLRAVSGDYITITLLARDENNKLRSGLISCTTSTCHDSKTECKPYYLDPTDPDSGVCSNCSADPTDCKRTLSSGGGGILLQ